LALLSIYEPDISVHSLKREKNKEKRNKCHFQQQQLTKSFVCLGQYKTEEK